MKVVNEEITINYVNHTKHNFWTYKNLLLMQQKNRLFLKQAGIPNDKKREELRKKRKKK